MLHKMLRPVSIASFIFAVAFLVFKIISRSLEKRFEKRKKELEEKSLVKKTIKDSYINEYNELQEKYNLRLLKQNKIYKLLFIIDVIIFVSSGLSFIFFQRYNKSIADMIYSAYSASAMFLAFIGLRLVDNSPKNNIT